MKPPVLAGAVLLAVFAAGAFTGIFIERHHPHELGQVVTINAGHVAPPIAEIREALQLDEEQARQIEAILKDHQRIVDHMWEALRPEVQKTMLDVHNKIADLLRPEQRQRLHQWLQDQRLQQQGSPPPQR